MKNYRVEWNETGFVNNGVWNVLDETTNIIADTEDEAISIVKDYFTNEFGDDPETLNNYVWRATENE